MTRYFRKIIQISALDSPNVQLAHQQLAAGVPPSNEILVPGILSYHDYVYRLTTWDEVLQCVGIHGRFWEGADALLFPPQWLNKAEQRAEQLKILKPVRKAVAIGCDPGEGSAKTAWAIGDEFGLTGLIALKTTDTSVIVPETIDLIERTRVAPENVAFDAGGGGKQLAEELRVRGYNVRIIAFGSPPTDTSHKKVRWRDKVANEENRSAFVNRRAEMYGTLAEYLDPALNPEGYGIPAEYKELRRQLALIPKLRDREGKLRMLPKYKRDPTSKEKTLTEILKCSPDESDAVCLMLHTIVHQYQPLFMGSG